MRLVVTDFDPSVHRIDLHLPAGSQLLSMRMSVNGHCQAVAVAEDETVETEPSSILILFEDEGMTEGGELSQWRWLGSWRYPSGRVAHGFVMDNPKKRRGRPPLTKAEDD